jgi:DNA modification methylase
MNETIQVKDIVDVERIRADLGDIDALATSIKRFGLIQPIILGHIGDEVVLIAGGRRLTALRRLSYNELQHGIQFVWKDEVNENEDKRLRFKSMEIEENIRRKDLSWQEQIEGKRQLLQIMQQLHGVAKPGTTYKDEKGFGTNRLAAMLGEAQSNTSRDLQLAEALTQIPSLRNADTKSQAYSQLKVFSRVIHLHNAAKATAKQQATNGEAAKPQSWTLIEEDFRTSPGNKNRLSSNTVDLVWTDLPYGTDSEDVDNFGTRGIAYPSGYSDSLESVKKMLPALAQESFRVLKNDSYAVFCFSFMFYHDLCTSLRDAGFTVDNVPFIWQKNTNTTRQPTCTYGHAYEPILVARKGNAVFIRPGQQNIVNIPAPQNRLHVVERPIELIEKFIKDTVVEGSTIVDWCAGTGTTGVAAHNLGMRSILFEKSPSMATLAKARLEALK